MTIAWNRKVSDDQLVDSYQRLQSVWKVAKEVGLCGQSVHERLKKHGLVNPPKIWTEDEIGLVKSIYEIGFETGDGKLNQLCSSLGKQKSVVSKKARDLGLSNNRRTVEINQAKKHGEHVKLRHQKFGHPRGMLGKKHSKKMCDNQSKRMIERYSKMTKNQRSSFAIKGMKTKLLRYGSVATDRKGCSWKQGWREVGGQKCYFRSRWEANYARYLQWQVENGHILKWEHEPKTFWFEGIKRGSVTYLPDFRVTLHDGTHYWLEVKGWMDARSKTKIKRFRKYFPEEQLKIADGSWFRKNNAKLSLIIKGWENSKES